MTLEELILAAVCVNYPIFDEWCPVDKIEISIIVNSFYDIDKFTANFPVLPTIIEPGMSEKQLKSKLESLDNTVGVFQLVGHNIHKEIAKSECIQNCSWMKKILHVTVFEKLIPQEFDKGQIVFEVGSEKNDTGIDRLYPNTKEFGLIAEKCKQVINSEMDNAEKLLKIAACICYPLFSEKKNFCKMLKVAEKILDASEFVVGRSEIEVLMEKMMEMITSGEIELQQLQNKKGKINLRMKALIRGDALYLSEETFKLVVDCCLGEIPINNLKRKLVDCGALVSTNSGYTQKVLINSEVGRKRMLRFDTKMVCSARTGVKLVDLV